MLCAVAHRIGFVEFSSLCCSYAQLRIDCLPCLPFTAARVRDRQQQQAVQPPAGGGGLVVAASCGGDYRQLDPCRVAEPAAGRARGSAQWDRPGSLLYQGMVSILTRTSCAVGWFWCIMWHGMVGCSWMVRDRVELGLTWSFGDMYNWCRSLKGGARRWTHLSGVVPGVAGAAVRPTSRGLTWSWTSRRTRRW